MLARASQFSSVMIRSGLDCSDHDIKAVKKTDNPHQTFTSVIKIKMYVHNNYV